jgi:hypothetical protein
MGAAKTAALAAIPKITHFFIHCKDIYFLQKKPPFKGGIYTIKAII